ncbi:MAG: hypothetical protein UT54_C0028G0004 [Candidatus Daviesbacteria bacterium GW2011_GWB1_39_5]|nr:MAG: hypothetical protein UT04_C0043G0007 [Candidatus Daviesbacteria bacterium GW2011_GWF2_38_7]KKR15564.1 MAG: hypothetical protein UT45_C0018G0004 [Candidatus Daviesbacteria bacterium GW2011_GWA2_39_33]KKR24146.1 MAG: hypothetical protein UT54_C0028G0004 [Candidatus Daviesbacteria bacterium GW2011_GWB1_39_5]
MFYQGLLQAQNPVLEEQIVPVPFFWFLKQDFPVDYIEVLARRHPCFYLEK